MAQEPQKCVHQSCGKTFTDPDEECVYHPGPPIFHEGQKGWKCCKPRVLTFDEFLSIPPCTKGKHSTTEFPPNVTKVEPQELPIVQPSEKPQAPEPTRAPISQPINPATPPPPPPESEDDDPNLEIPKGATCRRKGCGAQYTGDREGEKCVHHPGAPIFHEGSKGYSCCKRRVLEFDEFMKIEGCKTKDRHLFVGSGAKDKKGNGEGEEILETVRHDFYQTPSSVIASYFLKKINKDISTVEFTTPKTVGLNLITSDSTPKRYTDLVPLFGPIDREASSFKIMGTKLELTLVKADGASWPTLRSDEARTGEILQVGKAGRIVK
ncbi:chord-domain-containing protein [Xylogone sp. PMI_703]|nr:chord-domain-containing protein [Xylogone sp. PMI_703]